MAIQLNNLSPKKGSKQTKRRIGRGHGSSKGTTAGRGQKGQKARSGTGGFKRLGMRKLLLATPKLRGFNSPHAKAATINLDVIAKHFGKGDVVAPTSLKKRGLITTTKHGVKILSDGELPHAVKVQGCAVSKKAAEKILAAGGEIVA